MAAKKGTETGLGKQGYAADLADFLGKKLKMHLNARRCISGTLVGFDNYMNITMENVREIRRDGSEEEIGKAMIRGCNIVMWECIDKVALNFNFR